MEINLRHSVDMYTWKTQPSVWARQAVWSALAIVEVLLGMRLVLKLLGASFGTLQDFIYSVTGYLLVPFAAISKVPLTGESVFEWVTLLGIVSYWLLAVGLLALLRQSSGVSKIETARALSKKKYGQSLSLIGRE